MTKMILVSQGKAVGQTESYVITRQRTTVRNSGLAQLKVSEYKGRHQKKKLVFFRKTPKF